MAPFAWACAIVAGVLAITFLLFAAGGYDLIAVPLATMAWALGRVGLLLVPIGLLWQRALAGDRTARPRWLIRLSAGACIVILGVMGLIAFAASGSILLAASMVAVATRARNRGIANAKPLIEEIERYRTRRGTYPESLFSIWGDYKRQSQASSVITTSAVVMPTT